MVSAGLSSESSVISGSYVKYIIARIIPIWFPTVGLARLVLRRSTRFSLRAARAARKLVLLRALEALQGERYLRLAEKRPANEAFLYGWLANRIGTI